MLGRDTWGLLNSRQRVALAVALAFVVLVALVILSVQKAHEAQRTTAALAAQGDDITRQLEHELDIHRLVMASLQAFFAGSEEVTRIEFHRFTRTLLEKYPGIRLLAWAPLVPRQEKAAWEARARAEGVVGFGIQSDESVARETAEESVAREAAETEGPLAPLFFIEPEEHRPLLGNDLRSQSWLRQPLNAARDSGSQVVAALRIGQEPELGALGSVVLVPVYRPGANSESVAQRRKHLMGYLLGDANPATLLWRAVQRYRPRAVNVHVFKDEESPALAHHLADPHDPSRDHAPSLAALRRGPHFLKWVEEAGHRWIVVISPGRHFAAAHPTQLPWLTFGSVLLLGLLSILYVASLLAGTAGARRTAADLARSKADLEREISERARAEEDRARLATAIEQAGESFIVTDLDGRIQYVNPAFERVSGYSRQEVMGKSIMLLESGETDGAMRREIFDTLSRGEIWTGRFQNRRKDGAQYQDEATIAPVRDRAGRIVAYVSVQRDITEKLRLEARMRQVHKMEAMGTLAGGIAHDFNNILTAVLGHAELATQDTPPGSPVQGSLQEITRAAERAAALVAQILSFARQTREERRPLDVRSVIAEALRLLRGSVPSTVEIRQALDPNCALAIADPGEIHQVILNLGSNAFHAMREQGGTMTVILDEVDIPPQEAGLSGSLSPGRHLRLVVEDTGHGIDPLIRERIFEPYFTTKGRGEGTGMGLSTVHGILRNMGGSISVRSALGSGATFTLLFPAARSLVTKPSSTMSSVTELHGTERILLVDDEPQIITYLSAALSRMGYRVTACAHGKEALSVFEASPDSFDVVITDQMMPKLRGTELAAAIHAIRPQVPILLCSGFGDAMADLPTDEPVVAEVFSKPIKVEKLAASIRRHLAPKANSRG